ncbi:LOW QUALITY PROTEIN: uncharacterized protein LOC127527086 [Erpetoichthys calabaricus]|uniref:LOW QUALITY PROTEIN: uncharacterized protein LOC127527086 n=1 Tax=Erpetoichthys calabaricus TaxID=27687 RepID=UPI0022343718|nr:LOW QUALITY PROTEIN: uncharacterized protein LOC127527086 [Erpetoichthys calabaricus]
MCPCAVVYSIKFNIHAESPRNYADILLSWKHFPNICIYDFARGLVTHTYLRELQVQPFSPNEGRLAKSTPENIVLAKKGELRINLPWLLKKREDPDSGPDVHPVSGSSEHYALYDTFHDHNTKDTKDLLCRIELVPELARWLNSQSEEQLFASLKKNNYFMNLLSPSARIFLMRSIIHFRNEYKTKKTIHEYQKVFGRDPKIELDCHGRAKLALDMTSTQKFLKRGHPFESKHEATKVLISYEESSEMDNSESEDIMAKALLWNREPNLEQKQLLAYVLDPKGIPIEEIARTDNTVLNRADFLSLGMSAELEATGKDAYVANAYVVPTWLPPLSQDPFMTFPKLYELCQVLKLLTPYWLGEATGKLF